MRNNKQTKLFKIATAFTVATSPIVIAIPTEASTTIFKDVSETNAFYDAIVDLHSRGIIAGFPDGTFRPNEPVTRGQAAKILAGVLNLPASTQSLPFTDVTRADEYYGAIAALAERGIISGFSDGTFKSKQPITRNEMAKIITNAFNLSVNSNTPLPFTDIANSYRTYIEALYTNGITHGRSATIFDGSAHVTRGQLAAFVTRAENVIAKDTDTSTITFTVQNYSPEKITIQNKTYTYESSVQTLFTEANKAVLNNAIITAVVENDVITEIQSIELTSSGTAEKPLVLAGQIPVAVLIINGDYITITPNELQASLRPVFVAQEATMPVIIVNGNEIIITSSEPIAQLTIGANVTSITLNATIEQLQINATTPLTIEGQGTIETLQITNDIALVLNTVGTVNRIVVDNPEATVTLGNNTSVTAYTLPEGTTLDSIVTGGTASPTTPAPITPSPIIVLNNFTYSGQTEITHYIGETYTLPVVTDVNGAAVTPTGTVDEQTAGTYTLTYAKEGYNTLTIKVNVVAKQQFTYSGDTVRTHYIGDSYTAPVVTDAEGNSISPSGTVDANTAGTYTLTYEKQGYDSLTITVHVEAKKTFTYSGNTLLNTVVGATFTPPVVTDVEGNEITPTINTVDTSQVGTYDIVYEKQGYETLKITVEVTAVPLKTFTYTGTTTSFVHYIGDSYTAPVVLDEEGNPVTPTGTFDENTAGTYTLTYEKEGYSTLTITIEVIAKKAFTYNGAQTITHYIGDPYTAPVVLDAEGNAVTPTGTFDENTVGTYTLTYEKEGYNTITITVQVEAKKTFTYSGNTVLNTLVGATFTPPVVTDAEGNEITPTVNTVDTSQAGTYELIYEKLGYNTLTITVEVTAVPLKAFTYTGATSFVYYMGDPYTAPVVLDEEGNAVTPTGTFDENVAGTYTLTYEKEGYSKLTITIEVVAKKDFTYSGAQAITHYIGDPYTAPVVTDAEGNEIAPTGTVTSDAVGTYTLTYEKVGYNTLEITIEVVAKKDFTYSGAQAITRYVGDPYTAPVVKDEAGNVITPTGTVNENVAGTYKLTYEKVGYNKLEITIEVIAKKNFTYSRAQAITHYIGDPYTAPVVTDEEGNVITPTGTVNENVAGTYTLTYEKVGYNTLEITIEVVAKKNFTYSGARAITHYIGDPYTAPVVKDEAGNVITPTGTVNENVAGTYTLTYEKEGYSKLEITIEVIEKKNFTYSGAESITHYIGDPYTAPVVKDAEGNVITPTGTVNENVAGTYTLTYEKVGYKKLEITIEVVAKKSFLYSNSTALTHYIGDTFVAPFVVTQENTVVEPIGEVDVNTPNTYTLTYSAPGYYTLTITVTVKEKQTFQGATDGTEYTILQNDTSFTLPTVTDADGTVVQPNQTLDVTTVGRQTFKYVKRGYHDLTLYVNVSAAVSPQFYITGTNTTIALNEIELYTSYANREQSIDPIANKTLLAPGNYYYRVTKPGYRTATGHFTLSATSSRVNIDLTEVVQFTLTVPTGVTIPGSSAFIQVLKPSTGNDFYHSANINAKATLLETGEYTIEMSKKTYDEQFIHSSVTHKLIRINNVEYKFVNSGTTWTLEALPFEGYRSNSGQGSTNSSRLGQFIGTVISVRVYSPLTSDQADYFAEIQRDITLQRNSASQFNLDTVGEQIAAIIREVDPEASFMTTRLSAEEFRLDFITKTKRVNVELVETALNVDRMSQNNINNNFGRYFYINAEIWTGKPIIGSWANIQYD